MSTETRLPERIGLGTVSHLAWPICISMLSHTAMTVADSIFVGQLGTAELAAMGVAGPIVFLVLAFGLGVCRGTKIVVAQRTGAEDSDAVDHSLWQGLWWAALLGLAAMALVPLGRPLLTLMGGGEAVTNAGVPYFTARALGAPVTFAMTALAAWFEGRGDTRTPMKVSVMANALNIALDPIFIFGWGPVPAMGTGGAGVATVLAVTVGALAYIVPLSRVRPSPVSLDRTLMRSIWRLGSPMGMRHALELVAWSLFVSLLARTSEVDLAAHVIVLRVVSVSFLPGYAIGEATSVLVGQALGARSPGKAVEAWRAGTRLAVVVMGACAFAFVAFPVAFIAPFGAEGEVTSLSVQLLVLAALFQLFDAVAMVGQGVLNGAGDTRFVMWTSVGISWVLNLPFALLFVRVWDLGATGAWIALSLELAFLAAITVQRLRSGRWLAIGAAHVQEEERRLAA